MRQTISILIFTLLFVFAVKGQSEYSVKNILSPVESDVAVAKAQGFEVFKILPRRMFDYEKNELSVRGGGAYYSFAKQSHSYDEIPQIELQSDNLSVGFYGASYGFIADLGEAPLSEISSESKEL